MSRVLVTGGCGFLGSWVVDRLVETHKVCVVDDLTSGRKENLNPKAQFYKVDITHPSFQKLFEREKPEFVFHFAAQGSVPRSIENPRETIQINLLGSLNLLELCRRYGVKGVIYASSATVYGEPQYLPCDEEHPIHPLSPYGAALASVEHYLHLYHRVYGLNYRVLRSTNIYGPRQSPQIGGVVSLFIHQMLNGDRVVIDGTGDQERDFLFIDDAVEGFIAAFEHLKSNAYPQIYNLGRGEGISLIDLFLHLAKLTGYHQRPLYGPRRPGEVYQLSLHTARARHYLNWSPQVELAEGLERTVEWVQASITSDRSKARSPEASLG